MFSAYKGLAFLVLCLLINGTDCLAEETLCGGAEGIVFSCHIGAKTVSVCQTGGRSIVYRYGTPNKIELTYPDGTVKKKEPFFEETSPLYGGGVTYLGFRIKDYEYRIYSKTARTAGGSPEDRVPYFEDGLIILRGGKQIKQLICDDGGAGFRVSLDWLPQP